MRAEFVEMQGHVKNRSEQLVSIQQSTSTTSNDVRALRNMLEGHLGGFDFDSPNPKGPGRGHGSLPRAQSLPTAHENGRIMTNMMTAETHEAALA
eukprot:7650765-Pyramimonas_sp.AAC.1